jgi:DNA-binding GntR family transcriptional regulator
LRVQRSLAEKSYLHIRQKLARGEYAPGSRLVNRSLASEIGVSVIPVREAIHRLASEGLVAHIPGSGAFVPKLSWQDLDDLYVLRDALESCAAEEAARHMTTDQCDVLGAILERMFVIAAELSRRASKTATPALLNRWLDCEEQFHALLIESSRNSLLSRVIREHRAVSMTFEVQRGNPIILTADVARITCRNRRKLLKALRDGNPALSRRLMSEQIQTGRRTMLGHYSTLRTSIDPKLTLPESDT